ncbi:MAG: 50S ribosomal protein L13 [Thermoanaerobaculia bacterium]|nr:MAG: 50S ribosomal protein L13 [Thermoanaerobaculia bacterium]
MKSTVSPKPAEIERRWWVVDAAGIPVGRLSTAVARTILGKGKPIWAPHVDCGDFVIVVNAEKAVLTGDKERAKTYFRHTTQQPGSLKSPRAFEVRDKHPTRLVESAVHGMLPKTKLGRKLRKKLKVYAGPAHPHHAQKPTPLALTGAGA